VNEDLWASITPVFFVNVFKVGFKQSVANRLKTGTIVWAVQWKFAEVKHTKDLVQRSKAQPNSALGVSLHGQRHA